MTPLTTQVTPLQSPRGGAPVGAPDPAPGVGRSSEAVGQKAKVALEEMRAAGVDLPKNAQGVAASGIARGVDLASLFASQVAEQPPVEPEVGDPAVPGEDLTSPTSEDTPPVAAASDEAPEALQTTLARDAAQSAADAYGDVAGAIAVAPVDPNEIAAQLLADVTA